MRFLISNCTTNFSHFFISKFDLKLKNKQMDKRKDNRTWDILGYPIHIYIV